jgi:hypothetical protein
MSAGQKIGEVTTPSSNKGTTYPVYWDRSTNNVYVGGELAGTASSESSAMHVADYYASTLRQKWM